MKINGDEQKEIRQVEVGGRVGISCREGGKRKEMRKEQREAESQRERESGWLGR